MTKSNRYWIKIILQSVLLAFMFIPGSLFFETKLRTYDISFSQTVDVYSCSVFEGISLSLAFNTVCAVSAILLLLIIVGAIAWNCLANYNKISENKTVSLAFPIAELILSIIFAISATEHVYSGDWINFFELGGFFFLIITFIIAFLAFSVLEFLKEQKESKEIDN